MSLCVFDVFLLAATENKELDVVRLALRVTLPTLVDKGGGTAVIGGNSSAAFNGAD